MTQSWLTETVVLMLLLTYVIFMPVPTANSLQLLLDSVVFALLPRSRVSASAEARRVGSSGKVLGNEESIVILCIVVVESGGRLGL